MGESVVDGDGGQWGAFLNAPTSATSLNMSSLTITGYKDAAITSLSGSVDLSQVEVDGQGVLCTLPACGGIALQNTRPETATIHLADIYVHGIHGSASNILGVVIAHGDSGDALAGNVEASLSRITVSDIRNDVGSAQGITVGTGIFSAGLGPGNVHAVIANATISDIEATAGVPTGIGGMVISAQDHSPIIEVRNVTISGLKGVSSPFLNGESGAAIALVTGGAGGWST